MSATFMVQPQSGDTSAEAVGLGDDDAEQRRGYGAVDMRFDSCVERESDIVLRGSSCNAGILIFGPYVPVPANSQIEVTFEVLPTRPLEIYADTVSQMGKTVLGGLNPQQLVGGQNQKLGYFLTVTKSDVNVESRIGFRSHERVDFVLSNLTMTVR